MDMGHAPHAAGLCAAVPTGVTSHANAFMVHRNRYAVAPQSQPKAPLGHMEGRGNQSLPFTRSAPFLLLKIRID